MPTGLTRDAGWQIGVSRTLPADPDAVWAFLLSPEGLALWLGPGAELDPAPGSAWRSQDGPHGELRSLRPGDRIRLTHQAPGEDHETTVQVVVRPSAAGGTSLRFHQERMADEAERLRRRDHWKAVADRLAAQF